MIPTVSIKKDHLHKLPDEVLRLIGMGKYTLYRAEVKDQPDVYYILRTGEREFFFLQKNGDPISSNTSTPFEIQEKILIEDVTVTSVVPNFNRL
ncbi:hypothetical protein H6F51_21400 [Cyanobacteria bacterium FACHB-DQ100]|nr:hypothetical protein [Cyanobacteria bacterium FACHB-DQ100]